MSEGAVLITGGTGLIGANVARSVLERGLRPIIFDMKPVYENIADIEDKVVVERGDVGDLGDLADACRRHGVDRVLHLAAVMSIQAALKPSKSTVTNCIGTSNIFHLAQLFDFKRVVYASSAAVYGKKPFYQKTFGRHVVTEDDPPMPYDVYGSMKYLCEGLGAQAIRDGVDVVGLRPVMTFGFGRLDGAVGILNKAMRDAALEGRGVVTRPWQADTMINPMYAKDAADLFVSTLLADKKLKRPVYNLGTGEYLSIRGMMDLAEKSLSSNQHIDFDDVPPSEGGGKDPPSFDYPDLDSTAIRSELNWTARYGFEGGAAECIDMYRRIGQG
ncbi:MAG: NAD(P)-dependent oxidoreductase [Rhodobiaceae bacterium]|nr:NAD(P)-dependent oxidoreductase [Rhodobiaceae bacterium]MCC0056190.1 NAD(P)-dependent oxidoreductase [Rhodobiaceae bacterium]